MTPMRSSRWTAVLEFVIDPPYAGEPVTLEIKQYKVYIHIGNISLLSRISVSLGLGSYVLYTNKTAQSQRILPRFESTSKNSHRLVVRKQYLRMLPLCGADGAVVDVDLCNNVGRVA